MSTDDNDIIVNDDNVSSSSPTLSPTLLTTNSDNNNRIKKRIPRKSTACTVCQKKKIKCVFSNSFKKCQHCFRLDLPCLINKPNNLTLLDIDTKIENLFDNLNKLFNIHNNNNDNNNNINTVPDIGNSTSQNENNVQEEEEKRNSTEENNNNNNNNFDKINDIILKNNKYSKKISTNIFTPSIVKWLYDSLNYNNQSQLSLYSFDNLSNFIFNWYSKNLNFTIQHINKSLTIPNELKNQTFYIELINFSHFLLYSNFTGISIVDINEMIKIAIEYFSDNNELETSEIFLLEVTLLLGITNKKSEMINQNNSTSHLNDLLDFERKLLSNCLKFFNQLSTIATNYTDIKIIQSLILLTNYFSINFNQSIAFNYFNITIRHLKLFIKNNNNPHSTSLTYNNIIWHCYIYDIHFSFVLNQPTIFSLTQIDYNIDDQFFYILQLIFSEKLKDNNDKKDLNFYLKFVSNFFCDYNLLISYYSIQLSKIMKKLYKRCFFLQNSNENILNDINEIDDDLLKFEFNLPVCLKIKNFQSYINFLNSQNDQEFPVFLLSLLSKLTINLNYQLLFLKINLSLFTINLLKNNEKILNEFQFHKILNHHLNQSNDSSIKMVNYISLFKFSEYYVGLSMNNNNNFWFFHYFFTGIFKIQLGLIKTINLEELPINDDNTEIILNIKLLQTVFNKISKIKNTDNIDLLLTTSSIPLHLNFYLFTRILGNIINLLKLKYKMIQNDTYNEDDYKIFIDIILKKMESIKNSTSLTNINETGNDMIEPNSINIFICKNIKDINVTNTRLSIFDINNTNSNNYNLNENELIEFLKKYPTSFTNMNRQFFFDRDFIY